MDLPLGTAMQEITDLSDIKQWLHHAFIMVGDEILQNLWVLVGDPYFCKNGGCQWVTKILW